MDIDDHLRSVLLGEAVDRAGYIVLVADEKMRFLTASDGALQLLGYTGEELRRMDVPEIVQEDEAPDLYREMIRDGRQAGRVTLVCKGGSRVPAEYEAYETLVAGFRYYVSLLRPER